MARKGLVESWKRGPSIESERQPVLHMREAASIHAEVQDVQDLLPNPRLKGRIPGVTKASW